MPDDIDDLLRTAMKTLDGQVPSGYFDALPERVSARLDGGGEEVHMQQDASGSTKSELSTGVPPVKARDEDSGLHDIRNLAQSTKQRLSSKRVSTHPPLSHDDVLASSSASWKNLALPQPAKMVSLPEIDQLPSKHDIHAQDKAAKAAAKQAAREAAKFEAESPVVPPRAAASDPGASAGMEFKPAFSQFGAPKARTSHKGRNLALVGMGLAAAAGVTIFVTTQNNASSDKSVAAPAAAPAQTTSIADKTRALDEAAAKLQADRAAAAEKEAQIAAPVATGAAAPVEDAKDTAAPPEPAKFATPPPKAAKHGMAKTKAGGGAKVDETKPEVKQEPAVTKKPKPEPGDPDFDKLLKEAGVDQKKTDKPKIDKKQLSGDDFKKGMGAIQGKAQACFKGTQGTAAVKLTIAPSGQVSKVTVGGVFAGKPEADCVTAAVKAAQFPAWDGGPQSFGYPILLSE